MVSKKYSGGRVTRLSKDCDAKIGANVMGCCNRPPAGGPDKSQMGRLLKVVAVFSVAIIVLAYLAG